MSYYGGDTGFCSRQILSTYIPVGEAREYVFQNDIISQLLANGWKLGKPENYNREFALYPEDVLGFVQETQDTQWQQYCKIYPNNPKQKFLEKVASQLNKADPNADNVSLHTFGTLGVLGREVDRAQLLQYMQQFNFRLGAR